MKKRVLSFILSLTMGISLLSTIGYEVKASDDIKSEEYSEKETGLLEESAEGQRWLDENVIDIQSIDQLNNVLEINNKSRAISNNVMVPSKIDNSDDKYFPEIEDQIGGSCTSFAITYYMMTYQYNKHYNTSASVSENIMSPYWSYNLTNDGKDKGSKASDCLRVLKENGAANKSDVPFYITNGSENAFLLDYHSSTDIWEKAQNNKVKDYYVLILNESNTDTLITDPKDSDLDTLKYALSNGNILTFSTDIDTFRYETIEENEEVPENANYVGEYIVSRCDKKGGGSHHMTVVGYNDDIWVDINGDNIVQNGEKGAFKIANSWGVDYMNDGFVWVSYDALNRISSVNNDNISNSQRTALTAHFYGLTIKDKSENEEFYLELELSTSLRNTINIEVSNQSGDKSIQLNPFTNSGGSYGFTGFKQDSYGKFVFDLSDIDPYLANYFTKEKVLNEGVILTIEDTKRDFVNLNIENIELVDKKNNQTYSLLQKNISLDGSELKINTKDNIIYGPNNFDAIINDEDIVTLSWDPLDSNDINYEIYKNDILIATTKDTKYIEKEKLLGDAIYSIRAVYDNGTKSGKAYKTIKNTYCKIYYKNDSFNDAYIHYQLADGNWTSAPGIRMNKSSEKEGYFEYKLDLKDYDGQNVIRACFNNGNGVWDNNNNKDYYISKGEYILENGKMEKLYNDLNITDIDFSLESPQPVNKKIYFYPKVTGGSGDYKITYSIKKGNLTIINDADISNGWRPNEVGNYMVDILVKDNINGSQSAQSFYYNIIRDELLKITGLNFSKNSPQPCNSTIEIEVDTTLNHIMNDINYSVNITSEDGQRCTIVKSGRNKFTWIYSPYVGTYYIDVTVTDKVTKKQVTERYEYNIIDSKIDIESFKAYENSSSTKEISEIKASENYMLKVNAIGGSGGNYSYKYGYYFNDKYYDIEGNNFYLLMPSYLEEPGDYVFVCTVTDKDGSTATKTCELTLLQGDLKVTNPSVSIDTDNIYVNDDFNIKFNSKYKLGEVQYRVYDNDVLIQDFSTKDSIDYKAIDEGFHIIKIEGKDERGEIASNYLYFDVKSDEITVNFNINPSNEIILGESVSLNTEVLNAREEVKYSYSYRNILTGEVGDIVTDSLNNSINWTPSIAGEYEITVKVVSGDKIVSKTVNLIVNPSEEDFDIDEFISNPLNETTYGLNVRLIGKVKNNKGTVEYKYTFKNSSNEEIVISDYGTENEVLWYPTEAGTYTLIMYAKDSDGTIVKKEQEFVVNKQAEISNYTFTKNSPQNIGSEIKLSANLEGGTGTKKCKFIARGGNYEYGSKDIYFNMEDNASGTWIPNMDGTYQILATITDESGFTVMYEVCTYVIEKEPMNPLEISSIECDKGSIINYGDTANLSVNVEGGSGEYRYTLYAKNNLNETENILNDSTEGTGTWTPKSVGNYIIYAEVTDSNGESITASIPVNVEKNTENQVTIYYKGYETPYIHYKIDGGEWTDVPGVKMEETCEFEGYTHKATITLDDASGLTACFNNGSGSWDSNNGNNYYFGKGYYTYSNGKITEINNFAITNLFTDNDSINVGDVISINSNVINNKGIVNYNFNIEKDEETKFSSSNTTGTINYTTDEYGVYKVVLEATDEEGNVSTKTLTITVKDTSKNLVTIYYKGYDTPYIHYKIGNNAWTSVPGVEMIATSEMEGYTHKITIDLGEESTLTACFNNGSGSWDSNNGNNYSFNAGVYTYSSGQINKF